MGAIPELRVRLARISTAACKGRDLCHTGLSECVSEFGPDLVGEVVIADGLLGFIWRPLREVLGADSAALRTLHSYWLDLCKREFLVWRQAVTLQALFKREGLEVIFMRGPAWRSLLPPGMVRDISDLDLLVKPSTAGRLEELFRSTRLDQHRSETGLWTDTGDMLDIHTDVMGADNIATRRYAADVPTRELFARSRFISLSRDGVLETAGKTSHGNLSGSAGEDGRTMIRVLDEVDDLIFAAIHWVKHSYDRLCWAVDLAMLCERVQRSKRWNEVIERVARYRLNDLFACGLEPVRRMLDTEVPEDVYSSVIKPNLKGIAERTVAAVSSGERLNFIGYLLFGRSIRGWRQRFRFGCELLFPHYDSPGVMRFRYPRSPARLLPLLRIGRGLSGVVRSIGRLA